MSKKKFDKGLDKSSVKDEVIRPTRKSGGRKNYSKAPKEKTSSERGVTSEFVSSTGKPTNDPRWYLNNPYLSRDVGNIWFSRPTGETFPPVAICTTTPAQTNMDQYDPGIFAIPSIITWGGSRGPIMSNSIPLNSPINLTAQKLYQFVVHANSRNISYDKKDLLMSLMAIDSVYSLITEAIRAYRLIANYDPENRYVNRLLTAMNWDPDNLKANVSAFRYYINWAISRINKFYMPSLFDIVRAHNACYEHIYADRPTTKAQFYVKYSAGVWVYNDTEGALEYKNRWVSNAISLAWDTPHRVSDFYNVVSDLIARIENSQYMGVMQGDLLKAFGFENMSQYAYINIDMPIAPVYDEEFLYKLHNAHISPRNAPVTNTNLWIKQTTSSGNVLESACFIYRDDDQVSGNIVQFHGPLAPTNFYNHWTNSGTLIDLPASVSASPENVILMNLYKLDYETGYTGKWYLSDSVNTSNMVSGETGPEVLLEAVLYYDPLDMATHNTMIHTWNQDASRTAFMSRFAVTPMLTQMGVADGSQIPFFWHTDNVTSVSHQLWYRVMDVVFWSLWSNSTISSSSEAVRDSRI